MFALNAQSDDNNVQDMLSRSVALGDRPRTIIRHRAALACHSCRSLHARCDGNKPTCNRCKEEQRACQYPKSQRRHTISQPLRSPPTSTASIERCRSVLATAEVVQVVPSDTLSNARSSISMGWARPLTPTPCRGPEMEAADALSIDGLMQWIQDYESHRSIDSYYDFFHKAHPFAPTKVYMRSRIQSRDISAISLYAAMSYVGCMYQQSSPGRDLKSFALQQARRAQQAQSIPSTRHIYQVATLLLLAIVAYGRGELGEASGHLEKAISLSIEIGMNRVDLIAELRDREFAELWKRTYWYLYIVAEALEDTNTNRDFKLDCPAPDFPLPDTDDEGGYRKSAQKSSQMTLSRLDVADFEDHTPVSSSLAYLVNLVRTSRSVKKLVEQPRDRLDRTIFRADALLMNWKLHLPVEKQSVVTKSGEIDDIMLQSHILFYSLRLFVYSTLPSLPGYGNEPLHTRTKLEAAEAGVSLLTLHPCLLQMSPLNIKSLSRCAETSLNTAPLVESDFPTRDNLRLVLGALKQASTVWKTAEMESQVLKAMARKVFSPPIIHNQVIPTTASTSPTDVLSKDMNFQFTDATDSGPDGEAETLVEAGNGSMSTPFFETISGPLDDASVFLWHS